MSHERTGVDSANETPRRELMSDPVTRLNAALEGRYVIERELGEGGMATVYVAIPHVGKVGLKPGNSLRRE